jgi:hypothetical protein
MLSARTTKTRLPAMPLLTAPGAHLEPSSHNATQSRTPNSSHQVSLPVISSLTSLISSSQRTFIQRTQLHAQRLRAQFPATQTQTAHGALKNARRVRIAVDHNHATALLMPRPLLLVFLFVTSSQKSKSMPFARITKTRLPAMPLLTAPGAHLEPSSHNATQSRTPNSSHQASLPAISSLTSLTSSSQRTSIQRTQLLAQRSRAQSPATQTQTAHGALKNARRVRIAVDHSHATALLMPRPLLLVYSFVISSQRRKSMLSARTTKTRPPVTLSPIALGAHLEL